jgi:hypothetical protein
MRRKALRNPIRSCALAVLVIAVVASAAHAQTVTPGSDAKARDYYSHFLNDFGFDAKPDVTTLDDLLVFVGYPASAGKLELLDSAILMDPARASSPTEGLGLQAAGLNGATLRDGDILAIRFFAPKIANVNVATPTPGWRKLVRLRTRPDSRAARAGVESIIILFNFLSPLQQPFSTGSVNTQVMLLAPSHQNRLYWLDFKPDRTLGLALNATFDAADLPSNATGPGLNYFVPDGCNDCHGSPGNLRPPMVNYLDTDHWFDRLGDDFAALSAGPPLLFDAQTNDPTQASFIQAFDVIRRFNEEALLQNFTVNPKPDSFEAAAARTWLRIHAQSAEHVPPIGRAFSLNGGPTWQPAEAMGLGQLNRYCFRCHGSVRFSIFDRASVVERAGNMRQRIKPSEQQKRRYFKMPPDRTISDSDLQMLDDFLRNSK